MGLPPKRVASDWWTSIIWSGERKRGTFAKYAPSAISSESLYPSSEPDPNTQCLEDPERSRRVTPNASGASTLSPLPSTLSAVWRSGWFSALAYIALTLLCFGRLIGGGFLVDDWWWSATARSGGWPALGAGSAFYRPVSSFVFVEFFRLFGPNPLPYRLLILSLLVITALAIRAVWLKLSRARVGTASAFAAGAFFILWPTHAEAVGWISCFSDQLVAAFGATAIWLYLSFLEVPQPRRLIPALMAMAAALLSKESAVVLPVTAVIIGWAYKPKPKQNWTHFLVALLLTGGYIILRAQSIHNVFAGYGRNGVQVFIACLLGLNFTTNLANDFFPFARYLALYGGGHGIAWIQPLTLTVILALLGPVIRKPGRTSPPTTVEKVGLALFIFLTTLWAFWIFFFAQITGVIEVLGKGPIALNVVFVAALAALLFF